MKKTYRAIGALKGTSGITWDDERGCNIGPEGKEMWARYVAVSLFICL
jgi:hypothetical protein